MSAGELDRRFIHVFANLPSDIRKEIVVIYEEEPYSWSAINIEVQAKTRKSEQLLQSLDRMGLI